MEMPHIRISKKFLRKPALDLGGYFFYDQVITWIYGQFHEFKGRSESLQVNDTNETNRFTSRSEECKHVIPFDTSQIAYINVVTTVLPTWLVP